MTIPPLKICAKCGAKRHIYMLADTSQGKVCIDEKACAVRQRQRQTAAAKKARS